MGNANFLRDIQNSSMMRKKSKSRILMSLTIFFVLSKEIGKFGKNYWPNGNGLLRWKTSIDEMQLNCRSCLQVGAESLRRNSGFPLTHISRSNCASVSKRSRLVKRVQGYQRVPVNELGGIMDYFGKDESLAERAFGSHGIQRWGIAARPRGIGPATYTNFSASPPTYTLLVCDTVLSSSERISSSDDVC